MYEQERGDEIITLDNFRYLGERADWFHNGLRMHKKQGQLWWYCIGCDRCGEHKVRMSIFTGTLVFSDDGLSGPPLIGDYVWLADDTGSDFLFLNNMD